MNREIVGRLGRVLAIAGIALIFVAYSNFVTTAFSSTQIADYVKNHFVREILFGVFLAGWSIPLALLPVATLPFARLAAVGSIVVLPFWVGLLFGWSVGGMSDVWGDAIGPESAFALHGTQVALFYSGLALLWLGRDSSAD